MGKAMRAAQRRTATGMRISFACRLVIEPVDGRYGLRIALGRETAARAPYPIAVQLIDRGVTAWIRSGYAGFARTAHGVTAFGSVTAGSSRIHVEDRYSRRDGGLVLERVARIEGSSPGCGFLTAAEWDIDGASFDDPWFVPGVWYGHNEHAPSGAIGAQDTRTTRAYSVFREDRLPLPLLQHCDERTGTAVCLARLGATAETTAADDDGPLVDARIGFGSLGVYNGGRTAAYWFPGTEGETTYPPMWAIGRGNSQGDSPRNPFAGKPMDARSSGWVYRHHPLSHGAEQRYSLRIDVTRDKDWLDASDKVWQRVKHDYRPAVVPCDLDEIERLSVSVLAGMVRRVGPAVGIPTWVDCFTGAPGRQQDTFGVGVVARNLEVAYYMILYGARWGIASYRETGIAMLDFWTSRSEQGLAHTELDPYRDAWVDPVSEEGAPMRV